MRNKVTRCRPRTIVDYAAYHSGDFVEHSVRSELDTRSRRGRLGLRPFFLGLLALALCQLLKISVNDKLCVPFKSLQRDNSRRLK